MAKALDTTSIPESEEAVRHNKASLSVEAAFAAEGFGSPPAALAGIVADYVNRATRDIPASKLANMAPGSGNLGIAAATGVTVALGSLSPDQRSVLRAGGNPFSSADMMSLGIKLGLPAYAGFAKGEIGLNGGNGGRFASLKDAVPGSGADMYKALTRDGYNPAQIASAITYAHNLGVSDNMARKFIKLDTASRDDLQGFVNDVRNDTSLTDEQKAAKVAEFRKAHPKIGKTLTDQDVLKVIRGDDKQQIKARGVESSVHDDSQEKKFEDKARLGIARQTENQHRADAAALAPQKEQAANNDEFAAILARKSSPTAKAEENADAAKQKVADSDKAKPLEPAKKSQAKQAAAKAPSPA